MKQCYITTAIPYVNADPHIGFALELVQADVLARARRAEGKDVRFLTGTDDNALKNVYAAESAHVAVSAWVNEHAETFKRLALALFISNDDFIRTSIEERHRRGAQKLWEACKKDVYKKKYRGLYCLGCEEFKTAQGLVGGECPEHPGKKLEDIEEENYFFKLSRYEAELKRLIVSDTFRIIPESRKNETLRFIESGLEDFSISRSRERAKGWGIEVPGDPTQIMYVWFDALTSYINALGYATNDTLYDHYWVKSEEKIHMIGKGINRFHTIYWPAMLLSAGEPLPSTVFIHGYLTKDGQKISKTLGNVVDPFALIETYGADAVRYYLLREIPSYGDGDYSKEKFEERYQADLANGIGNFAARVLALGEKQGEISGVVSEAIAERIAIARKEVAEKTDAFRFHEAFAALFELIAFGDAYVNEKKPWEASLDAKKREAILFDLITLLDAVGELLEPFLPNTAEKIHASIAWSGEKKTRVRTKKGGVLFPRLESRETVKR